MKIRYNSVYKIIHQTKPFILSLNYAEACNELLNKHFVKIEVQMDYMSFANF